MVELAGLVVQPEEQRADEGPGPSLCQRNPATTQSAVRWCLIFSIARLPGWYGASSRFAMTPSSPAPSNRSNQSAASARSRVAGVRWTGGVAPTRGAARAVLAARPGGTGPRSSSPSASRSHATKRRRRLRGEHLHPGRGRMDAQEQGLEVEAPSGPTITTSPSRTHAVRESTRGGAPRALGSSGRAA